MRRPSGDALAQETSPTKRKAPTPASRRISHLTRVGWLSNQHGAWAMMLVPLLTGSILGGFSWQQLVATFAWLFAFFFFNALGLWMKVTVSVYRRAAARAPEGQKPRLTEAQKKNLNSRRSRFLPPMATYAGLAGVLAVVLIVIRPGLMVWAPAFAVVFFIAIWEMWRDRERSFLARASAIVASGFMTPIAFTLGSNPVAWNQMWIATVVLILYFIGTIPMVKCLIRERNNPVWVRFSLGFHAFWLLVALGLSVAGLLSWWIPLLWLVLLGRAAWLSHWSSKSGPLKPAVIGVTEFLFSALAIAAVVAPPLLS